MTEPQNPTFVCSDARDNNCKVSTDPVRFGEETPFDTAVSSIKHFLACSKQPTRTVMFQVSGVLHPGDYTISFPKLNAPVLVEVKKYDHAGKCVDEPSLECVEVASTESQVKVVMDLNHAYIIRIQGVNNSDSSGAMVVTKPW